MNYKLLLLFISIPVLTCAQEFSDKEVLESQLPILYNVNLGLFSLDKYSKRYEIDTLTQVVYFDGAIQENLALEVDNLEFDVSMAELSFPGMGVGKKMQQLIELKITSYNDIKLPRNKIKIVEHNLTDSNNEKIVLRDSLGYPQGGGANVSYQVFYLKNLGFGEIKGYVDLQFRFLTGYENHKISLGQDSSIKIGGKMIRILEYGKNYVLLKGDKNVLKNLAYSNLTDHNFPVVGKEGGVGIGAAPGDVNSYPEDATMFISSPSSKTTLPTPFFEPRIKNMSFKEYKIFFNENMEAFRSEEHMCLIKFNTEIINLFLHLPKYGIKPSKRIHIDAKISKR
ncbi:hypothetical protein V1387_00040 [Allomuricauda taeanensis]|uniref:hypothetical protein n=1 Tax=Flagellimonas taeanensis TaxID=1005926 RepID=UPI002E7B2452|nr:hypothetical protein [Allomuricauda taeanensis]MEE1961051.1 hypothetical protein [Allomuricauda taeanensis]